MIPSVTNFDTQKIPVEGDPSFRENASYVWSTIPGVITSFNSAILSFNDMINNTNINVNNVGEDIAKGAGTNQPEDSAVLNALYNAYQARLDRWIAQAHEMTANSEASEPEDVLVKIYTSNGDGTFSVTNSTTYSSLHSASKSQENGLGYAPVNGIIMYDGLIADIPAPWALCDGTNGTPNLVHKFVFGTATQADIGTTGGSADSVVVAHEHIASSNSAGSHTHTIPLYGSTPAVTTNPASSGAAYNGTRATGSSGAHAHDITVNSSGESGTDKNLPPYVELAFIKRIA